jgi:putative phage-type endonuclease
VSAVYLGHWVPNSAGEYPPEWYAMRRTGIGGSEISAVMGLSPFESMFSLWHQKQQLIPGVEVTGPMEWGNRLERAVLRKFLDMHPEWRGEGVGTWRHAERTYQIANPDLALIGRHGHVELVDAKTSRYGDDYGKEGTDEVPVHVRCQALWYLDTFDLEVCHIALLVAGQDYKEYVVHHDPTDVALMHAKAERFMASLENAERPDIDGHIETYRAVRELHPEIDMRDVDVAPSTARQFCTTKVAQAVAEAAHMQAKSTLLDEMGDAKRAWFDGVKIADRRSKNGGTPYLQAANRLPEFAPETTKDAAA